VARGWSPVIYPPYAHPCMGRDSPPNASPCGWFGRVTPLVVSVDNQMSTAIK